MEQDVNLPPPPLPPQSAAKRKRAGRVARWTPVALAVLALAVVGLAWKLNSTGNELIAIRGELAKRLAEGDSVARDAGTLAKRNQESIDQLQAKIGALDAKALEAQSQYAALEAMYTEFSRARDERSLTEIEQAITIAAEQLQLAGNVPAAVAALQAADSRLAVMDQARFLPLRKLIARDIEHLKTLPLADVASMALQLETLMGRIDSLPLGFERTLPGKATTPPVRARPVRPAPARKGVAAASAPAAQSEASGVERPSVVWRMAQDLWGDFSQLIRIERLDRPDPALLAPAQAAYLRENIRLRLLSARLALLQRDGRLFGEDIRQARAWLERYFDMQSKPVADLSAELQKIESAQLTMTLPNLEETTSALRALKLGGKR